MLRVTSLAFAACLAAATASASSVISYSWLSYSYSPRDIAYAGGPGELWTEVVGNPFGADQAGFDQAVTQSMYGAHFGPPTKFTTTPGPAARHAFHVRLLFNGTATDQGSICIGAPAPIQPSHGGALVLYAAFCQNDYTLSFLRAEGKFADERDPAFAGFMKDVTMKLFPPQNNELLNGGHNNCTNSSC